MATNPPPSADTLLVTMVCSALFDVWDLEVLCPCLDGADRLCKGACFSQTARALGISMTVGGAGSVSALPTPQSRNPISHCGTASR